MASYCGIDSLPVKKNITVSKSPDNWVRLEKKILTCKKCAISNNIRNYVVGTGNRKAPILFVGEAPGAEEDIQGEPFVGRAGKLLTNIITKGMKLKREDVYIGNIIKCRPPKNRDPQPEEVDNCIGYLKKQIEMIQPKVIVALGKYASHILCNTETPITRLRGTFYEFNGIPVMPTFHPSYLLRNPSAKTKVWEDIKKIMKKIGLPLKT